MDNPNLKVVRLDMLRRLWLVLSVLWAAYWCWIASTLDAETKDSCYALAFAPFIAGPVVWCLGRFVLFGIQRPEEKAARPFPLP